MAKADRAPFVLLTAWLVTAPVFLGAVPEARLAPGPLGRFIGAGGGYALFVVLGLAAAAALLPRLLGRGSGGLAPDRGSRWMLGLLALLPLLALLQLVPLPLAFHRVVAPGHAADLGVLLPESTSAPISTDPGLTLRSAVFLALLLFAAAVVLGAARGPRRGWVLLGAFVTVAALGAAYGILETYHLGSRVLSHSKGPADTGVTGTFFYRGTFAAFSAAALGVAASALVTAFLRRRPLTAAGAAMAVAVLAAAILLSKSRAGLVAGSVAALVGLVLSVRTGRQRLGIAAVVIIAVAVAVFSLEGIRQRFGYFTHSAEAAYLDVRIPAWESTLELAGGRPVFGCGMGAYRRAIHLTQSPLIDRELYYAHSDPLNLLAEGGALGLLLLGAVVVLGVGGAIAFLVRGGDTSGVSPACAGGLTGLLAMSFVDFPLQIPATALAFVTLLFLPAAARAPRARVVRTRSFAWVAAAAVVVTVAVLATRDCARWWGCKRPLTRGEELAERGPRLAREGRVGAALRDLEEARELQPFEGVTRYQLAEAWFRSRGTGSDACRAELEAAHRLAHGNKVLLYAVGTLAYRNKDRDLAERAFREAGEIDVGQFYSAFLYFTSSRARDLSMVVTILPDDDRAVAWLARWLVAWERTGDEIAAFGKAVSESGRPDLTDRLAGACRFLKREADGRRRFTEAGLAWPGE